MPKALEEKLEKEAQKHGYEKGSRRYNAYVYGTMNAIEHNRAGGPEKVFKGKPGLDLKLTKYNPRVKNVHAIHIGIVMAVLILIYFWCFGSPIITNSVPSPAQVNPNVPDTPYPAFAGYSGWVNAQYNQLGAYAGALRGEAD